MAARRRTGIFTDDTIHRSRLDHDRARHGLTTNVVQVRHQVVRPENPPAGRPRGWSLPARRDGAGFGLTRCFPQSAGKWNQAHPGRTWPTGNGCNPRHPGSRAAWRTIHHRLHRTPKRACAHLGGGRGNSSGEQLQSTGSPGQTPAHGGTASKHLSVDGCAAARVQPATQYAGDRWRRRW